MIWNWRKRSSAGPDEGPAAPAAPAPEAPPLDLPLDVVSEAFLSAPDAVFDQLRDEHPLCPLKRGGVLLTRHEDVAWALGSPQLGNTPSRFSALHPKKAERYVAADVAAHCLPFLDGAAHRAAREAVVRAFHRTLRDFKPRLAAHAQKALAPWHGQTDVDLVEGPARAFSCTTIADFVGLDGGVETVKPITEAFFRLFAPVRDAADFEKTNAGLARARAVFDEALAAREADGRLCFLTHLADEVVSSDTLNRQHVLDNAMLILADGVENIEAAIGQAFWMLTASGDGISEAATREVLRLHSPAQIVPRVCLESVEYQGTALPEGSPVFLALASANRDPNALSDADGYDPARGPKDVMTFGAGTHACVGERLAVLMITELCRALQSSGAEVDANGVYHEPVFGHRWIRGLKVSIPPQS